MEMIFAVWRFVAIRSPDDMVAGFAQVEQARECVYDSSSTSAKLKTITTLIYSIQTDDSPPPLCVWVCVSYFGTGGGWTEISHLELVCVH